MGIHFTKFEKVLWCTSCGLLTLLFLMNPEKDVLTYVASLIGATMLILLAKGHPAGQILTIVFAIIYAVISYRLSYYGEMITYLGMTAPTAALAAYQWIKNPYEKGKAEVKVAKLTRKKVVGLILCTVVVTGLFFVILKLLHTANLPLSTISIATSFLASALTVLRSPLYALGYAANDLVLILLWGMASVTEPKYWPMTLCFCVFFANDAYGYVNWKRMETKQQST